MGDDSEQKSQTQESDAEKVAAGDASLSFVAQTIQNILKTEVPKDDPSGGFPSTPQLNSQSSPHFDFPSPTILTEKSSMNESTEKAKKKETDGKTSGSESKGKNPAKCG